MSGEMAIAYFLVHAPHGFHPNHNEDAIQYCFVFSYLVFTGTRKVRRIVVA